MMEVAIIGTERMPNESRFDYHKRLVYGKLVDKTLADVDYAELAELVYGKPYSSDVARRMLYGSRNTLELMEREGVSQIDDNKLLTELDLKRAELQMDRQRFFDQRREYNKLVASDARQLHLYESLTLAAQHLDITVGSLFPTDGYQMVECGNNEAVLVFCDWHYGMKTSNIFNRYDTEICKQRVIDIVDKAVDRIHTHGCRRLHILILGDLFHGAIHTSARVASEELVCDQIMQVSEILAQAIARLSKTVGETIVYMTYGNHARTVQKYKDSIHRDNMERLVPWWLRERLKGEEGITILEESENEFLFLNVCGYGFCGAHGDNDSIRTSTKILPTLFQKTYGVDVDYIILGDKHHREVYDDIGVEAMICGSLCGPDDHANNKRLYSKPGQSLFIVNEENGIDAEYYIKCK